MALITCYNKEERISDVLNACLMCEEIDFLHVYDDCSTDGSVKQLLKFEHFDKIKITLGDINRGVAYARNYLFENTQADIYVLNDGDDVIIPRAKSIQIKEVKSNNDLLFSYSDYYRVLKKETISVSAGCFSFVRLEMYNFIPFSSVIVRKKHHFEKTHHEDYLCWLFSLRDLSEAGVYYFDSPTFYYNTNANSLSSNMVKGFLETFAVKRRAKISYMKIVLGTAFYLLQAIRKRVSLRFWKNEA